MKVLWYVGMLFVLEGCGSVYKTHLRAESHYNRAFSILTNTTHNVLSRSLSDQALREINKAIALDPSKAKYFRVKGTTFHHQGNNDSAIVYHLKAIQLDSGEFLAWMGLAIAYENNLVYDSAERYYLKAYSLDSLSPTLWHNFAILYHKWDKDSLSLLAYDKCIEMRPGDVSGYLGRGHVKLLNRSYKAAVTDFDIAIIIDPSEKQSYNNRGLCKFYLGQYETAIVDFKKALSIKMDASFNENYDTDEYAYNNLANSYFMLGKMDEACNFWKLALLKGYKYEKEWKDIYGIEDPQELVRLHCSKE